MNDIIRITQFMYDNAHELEIKSAESWDRDLFLSKNYTNENRPNEFGLFWILSDFDQDNFNYEEIHHRTRKNPDFETLIAENKRIFGEALINSSDGLRVVFVGQADNVMNRLRCHFFTNNNTTFSLYITRYRLAQCYWKIKYFSFKDLGKIQDERLRNIAKNLFRNTRGRFFIENTWRSLYGWPILNKV
ncbi:MAG: hypothetical protein KA797_08470 [Chitinophagales bacterium]|nr:hypothetical protein [Chitinophagales bacterium]